MPFKRFLCNFIIATCFSIRNAVLFAKMWNNLPFFAFAMSLTPCMQNYGQFV